MQNIPYDSANNNTKYHILEGLVGNFYYDIEGEWKIDGFDSEEAHLLPILKNDYSVEMLKELVKEIDEVLTNKPDEIVEIIYQKMNCNYAPLEGPIEWLRKIKSFSLSAINLQNNKYEQKN